MAWWIVAIIEGLQAGHGLIVYDMPRHLMLKRQHCTAWGASDNMRYHCRARCHSSATLDVLHCFNTVDGQIS
jgi:hypothetical protein